MTHICVVKLIIIGSDNGLSLGRRQAIIWTNTGILLIGPLGTNFSEIFIGIHTFSFKKILLKMSSAKLRPFCLGLNVLNKTHVPGAGSGVKLRMNVEQYEYMPGPNSGAGVKLLVHDQRDVPMVKEMGQVVPPGSNGLVGIQITKVGGGTGFPGAVADLLINGSTAFKWKLCYHWLKDLGQCQTAVELINFVPDPPPPLFFFQPKSMTCRHNKVPFYESEIFCVLYCVVLI